MVDTLVTSSHIASQHSGFACSKRSGKVSRQIGPEFITSTRPLAGLKPILNSPVVDSAEEPAGAKNVWYRGAPGAVGSAPPKPGNPPPPVPGSSSIFT